MKNLFLDEEVEKTAGYAARLSETAENWPQELTSELLKQLPYLSDYEMSVNLDRVEPNRGFAFGYADIANRTERPETEHDEAGIPHLRIPIVVNERSVKPFAVYVDGESVLPLSEERVRENLFNPTAFDLSSSAPRDPNISDNLNPPNRMGMGGGEVKMASAMTKEAASANFLSKLTASGGKKLMKQSPTLGAQRLQAFEQRLKGSAHRAAGAVDQASKTERLGHLLPKPQLKKTASLLSVIAPTIRESDAQAFMDKLASDYTVMAGLRASGIVPTLIQVFDKTKRASASERAEVVVENILPTVVTLTKLPGGDFLVKSAATKAFKGDKKAKGEVVKEEEAAQAIGPENAQAMQPGQTVSAVADPVQPQAPVQSRAKPVEEFGEYKVQDTLGNTVMGWVFPQTIGWDGEFSPQPIALFSNGSAYAFQDTIVGELVGKGTNLPVEQPLGEGCFYTVDGGEAICTQPITIRSSVAGPDGQPKLVAMDAFGQQIQVMVVEGLTTPTRLSDIEFGLPSTWKFMRLNNQTQLAQDAGATVKTAQARESHTTVELFYNGAFQLRGGCGLEKVATELRQDMDAPSAEFMLGVLGVDSRTAKSKLAQARREGSVKMAGLKTIVTLAERFQEAEKTASALISEIPNLRRDLVKEASSLKDESTVDNLLALNFINPENVATFVSYLPELDETAGKMSEMLLTSYLGMNELPEVALERGLKQLDEVISTLKALQHTEAGAH